MERHVGEFLMKQGHGRGFSGVAVKSHRIHERGGGWIAENCARMIQAVRVVGGFQVVVVIVTPDLRLQTRLSKGRPKMSANERSLLLATPATGWIMPLRVFG